MPITAFELPGLVISQIFNSNKGLVILAQTNQSGAVCPNCQNVSERVHSYYSRQAQDLPISDKSVELKLRVRRFRCLNSQCPQKIFAERLTLLVPHAQRSSRLKQALKTLAVNLSAEVAATLVPFLHLGRISPDTLLRMVKQSLATSTNSSTIIGVDDFAFRRGQRYGTIIVDLAQHKPIDLLPDRSAATLTGWLKSNPQVELITRDRSTEYARAITQGAPNALQVADRWHIIKNWKEVLERIFQRLYAPQMQRLKKSGRLAVKKAGQRATSSSSSSQRAAAKAARERRIARYDAIKELEAGDCNISEIAQQLQMSRTTGSPRVRAALVQKGVRCSRRKVARLMREKGLVSCWRRKKRKVCTTDSQHNQPVAPNRLNRDFTATAPNQKWMGDITGVWTEEGWLYLAALVDVYSRKVVGWATRYIRDEQLVFGENALWMALIGRQPEAGLVHHTDRGSQYTARSYLVPRGAFTLRGRAFNEQSWELLGQCVVRKLLRQFEGGMHRPLPFCKSANG